MTIAPRIACEPAATVSETTQTPAQLRTVLRRCLLDARTAIGPDARLARDAAIAAHLGAWLTQFLAGSSSSEATTRLPALCLGVYWPIRGEPDLRPLYARLAATGFILALPVMTAPDAPLQFARWMPDAPLVLDRWGIATPQTILPVDPSVLLIPCVGVNATGHRLGYGGGFYDRTLASRQPRPLAIGIATDGARCNFNAAAHDMPMDVVITETRPA